MNLFYCLPIALLSISFSTAEGLSLGPVSSQVTPSSSTTFSRRSILQKASIFGVASVATAVAPFVANAADAQFVEVGQQEKPPNGETPFSTLPNGVQVKDFRQG